MATTSKVLGTPVQIGQVWIDNDPRSSRVRKIRVISLEMGGKAVCVNVMTGKVTKIALARFRPTASGYRLDEAAAKPAEARKVDEAAVAGS